MREYYLSVISGQRSSWDAVLARALLRLCSWIYVSIVMELRWLYQRGILRSYDLGRPVISVGNITWGGVGKTPIIEWMAQEVLALGKHPVILMRGYMPKSQKSVVSTESDEAKLLHDVFGGKVPVIAQKDRVQGALKVPGDYHHDAFLLDDGFQHWRVKRDLDIVVIDAMDPFGNGSIIPRGSLREPMSALKHTGLIVISRVDHGKDNIAMIKEALSRYAPGIPIVLSAHQPSSFYDLRTHEKIDEQVLKDQSVFLVSGIGNPKGFEETVKSCGIAVAEHVIFPDHHMYSSLDVDRTMARLEQKKIANVIITEKDAVKLRPLLKDFGRHIALTVLAVKIKIIEGQEEFHRAICTIVDH